MLIFSPDVIFSMKLFFISPSQDYHKKNALTDFLHFEFLPNVDINVQV